MRKNAVLILSIFLVALLMRPLISNGQTLTLGSTYLNQTLNGEKLPNIIATDFSFQLDAPNAVGTYRARLHNDELLWSRLEVGPRYGNIQAFYSLDLINEMRLNGAAIRFSQTHGTGRSIELMGGVYDRGYCAEATCTVERNGFVGRIGMEYRKLQDLRFWGPSVSIGWGW